jgi:lipopolysaccharide exporter
LVVQQLKLSTLEYGKRLWRPFVATMIMATVLEILKMNLQLTPATTSYLLALICCVLLGAVIYPSVLYFLWRLAARPNGAERFCLERLEGAMGRFGIRVNLVGG